MIATITIVTVLLLFLSTLRGHNVIGLIIGAGLAAGAAAVDANIEDKKTPAGRPKRRKLEKFKAESRRLQDRRLAMLAALAQSHLDYANLF